MHNIFLTATILITSGALFSQQGKPDFSVTDGIACTDQPQFSNEVKIYEKGDSRVIESNSVPDHTIGLFPNRRNPNTLSPQKELLTVPLNPKKGKQLTSVYTGELFGVGTPSYEFGVAINGVMMEPSAAEAFENRKTGEKNFEWTKEALSSSVDLGDDCNNAHVQPSGKYHYHGTPTGVVKKADNNTMFLTGWAADGFPIYYKYGYKKAKDSKSELVELRASYRIKSGERKGDGIVSPDGKYDGTYVRDYEYVKGLGDLDEANGRFGVTPEFPKGTYYYVITDHFPSIPRYFVGTPSEDFKIGRGGRGPGNGRGRNNRQGQGRLEGQDQDQRGGRRRPSLDQLFQDMDQNRDNMLSKEEVRGPLLQDFDRIDQNKDTFITKEEIQEAGPRGKE